MNNFPWADIHELLSPDLLHQLIKGCFKDHLVTWIVTYIENSNSNAQAKQILNDIDRQWVSIANSGQQTLTLVLKSISLTLACLGLRNFHQACGFKQWTGDDSKALMKVCLQYRFIQRYTTKFLTDLFTSNWRICAQWHDKGTAHFLRILLPGLPQHTQ